MDKKDSSAATFSGGLNCAASVLGTFAGEFGLDRETAFRLGGGLGGGVARHGWTCGAVAGALLVIGLKYGASDGTDTEAKDKAYQAGRDFIERFTAIHGTTECRMLLGSDLNQPGGLEFARQNELFSLFCPNYVRDATGILEEMLAES